MRSRNRPGEAAPQLLDDPLDGYARALAEAASRAAQHRANETELAADLDPIIRQAARDLFGLDDLHVTAERRVGGRPYDKAYGGVVVEWEWRMSAARRRQGAGQAVDYLQLMRSDVGIDEAFTAIVCDGREWGFLVQDPGVDDQISLLDPEIEFPDERFAWVPNSPSACRRFLQLIGSHRKAPLTGHGLVVAFGRASEIASRTLTLLVENLRARDPDDRSDTLFREWRRVLEVVYGNLDDDTDELANQIREAYGLTGSASLGELLFSLHTYFGLVVRLAAVEFLAISANEQSARPSTWATLGDAQLIERLRQVDEGELPSSLHVANLFEGDVFSWYLEALEGSPDLVRSVRDVIGILDGFAFPRIAFGANPATDILRDLYQELVPRTLRRRLGEFLTPHWLAEAAIEEVAAAGHVNTATARVLDPTCGTATFLIPIIAARARHLATSSGDEIDDREVARLTDSVVGYDINPIAVLAARVNYLIALGDIPSRTQRVTLPIWRADSILVPDVARADTTAANPRLAGRTFLALRTSLEDPFPIPPELADAPGLNRLVSLLRAAIHAEGEPYTLDEFAHEFDASMADYAHEREIEAGSDEWTNAREVAIALYEVVLELERAGRNGVWLTIIQNNFAPVFEGRFDLVIGNPPWLTWTRLPEAWRRVAEPLWRDYGFWRVPSEPGVRRSRSLASSDLAILVYGVGVERYVREGGTVALLAPRSLISADPGGRAFRRFHLAPDERDAVDSRALSIDFQAYALADFSGLNPFSPDASNQPIFLISRRGPRQMYPVPTTVWRRAESGARLAGGWSAVRPRLRRIRGESNPITDTAPTSAWSFVAEGVVPPIRGGSNSYRFGKGLDTRGANGVFFVRAVEDIRSDGTLLVVNTPSAGRAELRERQGRVDAALVWPLLRGEDVAPWVADPGGLILCPHDPDELERALSRVELQGRPGDTYAFLRAFRERLLARSSYQSFEPTDDCYWMLSGPLEYMQANHTVVVREIQNNPAAAVLSQAFHRSIGRSARPMIEHKLLFCAVASEEEALHLAGCINSQPIQDLLASFANPIATSPQTLARLPIPTYDAGAHGGIVAAARACQDAVAGNDASAFETANDALAQAFLAAV